MNLNKTKVFVNNQSETARAKATPQGGSQSLLLRKASNFKNSGGAKFKGTKTKIQTEIGGERTHFTNDIRKYLVGNKQGKIETFEAKIPYKKGKSLNVVETKVQYSQSSGGKHGQDVPRDYSLPF